jgi:hypothetical protein
MAHDPAFDMRSKLAEIQKSLTHLHMLSGEEREMIESYCNEWGDIPLPISFQLMNWAMRKINTNKNGAANYIPYLLTPNELETTGIHKGILHEQVDNAQRLDQILHTFPRLENRSMTVYRGETCNNSFYYQKAKNMNIGEELVILPFLSTSVNPRVATRYAGRASDNNACVWQIEIPKGQIFPYIAESAPNSIPHNLGNGTNKPGPEYEVLLPSHARLRLVNKFVDERSTNIQHFVLIGFAEKSADFWEKTRTHLLSVDGVPEDAAAVAALEAARDEAEAAAESAAAGPAPAAAAEPAPEPEPEPLRRSTRGKKPKLYGGKSKSSKTRKRTKRNRKSRRKVRK